MKYFGRLRFNIGFAAAVPGGLVVPVVKESQDMTLQQLSATAHDLTQRARSKGLTAGDLKGGNVYGDKPRHVRISYFDATY